MVSKKVIGGICGAVLALWGSTCLYTLSETQQAVITSFGRPVRVYVGSFEAGKPDEGRIRNVREWADQNGYGYVKVESTIGLFNTGLHTKLPWPFESVVKVEDKLLDYSDDPESVQTVDKQGLVIDSYAKWYIENPLQFYLSVRTVQAGSSRIDDAAYSARGRYIGQHSFSENIRTTDRKIMTLDGEVKLAPVKYGREKILQDIIRDTSYGNPGYDIVGVGQFGMNIVDIRFNSVELHPNNVPNVCDRMIAERGRIKSLYLAEGDAESLKITSGADRDVAKRIAKQREEVGEILGAGESEAAEIYTAASKLDPEFFKFWRTMKAYERIYGEKSSARFVLETDTEFNRFLEE